MVPSPKVATYDLKPEMNAAGVGEEVKIKTKKKSLMLFLSFSSSFSVVFQVLHPLKGVAPCPGKIQSRQVNCMTSTMPATMSSPSLLAKVRGVS